MNDMTTDFDIAAPIEIPDELQMANINDDQVSANVPDQDFIDGYMLPCGACTMLSTAGGSGKTTAGMSAGIRSACNGMFEFFGSREHHKPLRVVLVYGEETGEMISRKIVREMGLLDEYHTARESGRLSIISMIDFMKHATNPERIFDEAGALTETGRSIFSGIRKYSPDFIMFDTLSSLSDGDYLQDRVAYTTLRELNGLAADTNAAMIMTTHLVKGGASKITATSNGDDLISLSRGSAAITNAARHAVVLVPAPEDAYTSIEVEQGDQRWMCGVKSNMDFPDAGKAFPIIRSQSKRTFTRHINGVDADSQNRDNERRIIRAVRERLVPIVRVSAFHLSPFAESGNMSLPVKFETLLAGVMPKGATRRHIKIAQEELVKEGALVIARNSAVSTPLMDVPGGPFANPEDNLDDDDKPPKFRKGVPPIAEILQALEHLMPAKEAPEDKEQVNEIDGKAVETPNNTDFDFEAEPEAAPF